MVRLKRKLVREVVHNRAQLLSIMAVIAGGIALFVSMGSVRHSLEATRERFYSRYRFADLFAPLSRAPLQIAQEVAAMPGVAAVTPRIVTDVTLDVPGLGEPATGRLVSIPDRPAESELNGLHIVSGRRPMPFSTSEAVASLPFMRANGLKPGDRIAAVVHGRWKQLHLVGTGLSPEYVYEVQPGALFPDNRRFGVIWMGRTALASAMEMSGACNDISLTLQQGALEAEIITRLDRLLEPYGSLGVYHRKEHLSDRFIADEIMQLGIMVTFLPTLFLAVAVFLVHMTLSRLVAVQREQIAVLKAMGFSNREIGLHYLGFALAPAVPGSLAGVAVGALFGRALLGVYAEFYNFADPLYRFEWSLAAVSVLASLAAALFGAGAAVGRVMALPPAEAIRPEAPARYRPGLTARLSLLQALPASVRMVVRSIGRRPWKAALSCVLIALAVALLVAGRYSYDAVEHIVAVEFGEKHREDVTLLFNEPMPPSVASGIGSMAGVLQHEYYRQEPARLVAGHRSRRQPVMGMPADATLYRLVDSRGAVAVLPDDDEGILLSATLAELLGVAPGDTLVVNLLEGSRRSRPVRVGGTIDEILGLSATMRREALDRLAGDGGVVHGAWLRIEPASRERLFATLKRLPGIAGVMMVPALRESFEELIARSLVVSTLILTLFACVLAFGVIYNGARISLSERARELSSLRVLGMTKREVTALLLGEQALLTLLALPLGSLFGIALSALLAHSLSAELYRLPLVFSGANFVFAWAVAIAVSMLSGLVVRRRLVRLDLIAVLKTRE